MYIGKNFTGKNSEMLVFFYILIIKTVDSTIFTLAINFYEPPGNGGTLLLCIFFVNIFF